MPATQMFVVTAEVDKGAFAERHAVFHPGTLPGVAGLHGRTPCCAMCATGLRLAEAVIPPVQGNMCNPCTPAYMPRGSMAEICEFKPKQAAQSISCRYVYWLQ